MIDILAEVRQAARSLRRTPAFTVAAVLTLSLGIGATTTLVSVVDTLMFRPPSGVDDPGRVVRPYFHFDAGSMGVWTAATVSYPDFTDLRDHVPSFGSVAAYYTATSSLGQGPNARPLQIAGVSGGFFSSLGAQAWRGRLLGPEDDSTAAPAPVAVLSERFWRAELGADPAILGRELLIGGNKYSVVGITQPGFSGADLSAPDVWIPLSRLAPTFAGPQFAAARNNYFIRIFARLAPGATPAVAAEQATAAIAHGRADSTISNGFQYVELGPIQEARGPETNRSVRVALWLVLVSGIVLLVACANAGNLLLARGLARSREFAIRKALGARRSDLLVSLVVESLVLAALGGVVAGFICVWGGGSVRRFLLPASVAANFHLDLRVCAVAGVLSLLAGLLAGVLPGFRVARGDLTPALKEGGDRGGYRRSRLRSSLVVAQVGLSTMLVIGAGLFVRSLRNVLAVDTGYDLSKVVLLDADLTAQGYRPDEIGQAFAAMQQAVSHHPGVESAAIAVGGPFGWSFGTSLRLPGRDSVPRLPSGGPYYQQVTPQYLATVGLHVLQGRDLAASDRVDGTGHVAVIGQTMARLLWPGANPLGQCFYLGDGKDCVTVVGVAQDGHRNQALEARQMILYLPLPLHLDAARGMALYVRVRGDARHLAPAIREMAQRAVPNLPYVQGRAMVDIVAPQYDAWRMGATIFSLFGALALALAVIGIYGLLAYTVRGRRRELGIRLALGAPGMSLARLVLREGVGLTLIGLAFGFAGAIAGGRAMASLLYGVTPTDPTVLGISTGVLAVAALAACVIPARRATRVDPMSALRSE